MTGVLLRGLMPNGQPRIDITRSDGPEILFKHEELACKRTGVVRLHPGFAEHLAWLRMVFAQPMVVSSCCRSEDHNRAVGGKTLSLHIWDRPPYGAEGTLAIDVIRRDGGTARRLVACALEQGWSVGVAASFLHLDRRDLVGLKPVLFGYGNGGQTT